MKCTLFISLLIPTILALGHRPSKSPSAISPQDLQTFTNAFFDLRRGISPTGNLTLDALNLFTSDFVGYSGSIFNINEIPVPAGADPPPFATSPQDMAKITPGLSSDVTQATYFLFAGGKGHETSGVWHWRWTGVGDGKGDVLGFTCFDFRWVNGKWKAFRISEDFDSQQWFENIGGRCEK